jgi:hypothetical protein
MGEIDLELVAGGEERAQAGLKGRGDIDEGRVIDRFGVRKRRSCEMWRVVHELGELYPESALLSAQQRAQPFGWHHQ